MIDLNKNNIICWDMREILVNIPDESIDCCVTDCPYKIIASGISISENWEAVSDGSKTSDKWLKKDWSIPSGVSNWMMFKHNNMDFSDWLWVLYRVMKPKSHIYIMINGRNLAELQTKAEKVGFKYQNTLVWDKGNCTPNKYYMQACEFILLLRKWWAKNINNLGTKNIISVKNIIGKKKHPTEKPAELFQLLIENSTNPWEIVLDPFCWCWPIVEACKNSWRKYLAIDIDENFISLAKERW